MYCTCKYSMSCATIIVHFKDKTIFYRKLKYFYHKCNIKINYKFKEKKTLSNTFS